MNKNTVTCSFSSEYGVPEEIVCPKCTEDLANTINAPFEIDQYKKLIRSCCQNTDRIPIPLIEILYD